MSATAPVALEAVPCPLGCAPDDEIVVRGHDRLHELPGEFTVVRCRGCGLLRTTPRPTPEAMGFYYPAEYGPYLSTRVLEDAPGVAGYELNVSCPNTRHGGIYFSNDPALLAEVTGAVKRVAKRPLIVKLSPNVAHIAPPTCMRWRRVAGRSRGSSSLRMRPRLLALSATRSRWARSRRRPIPLRRTI